MTFFDSLKKWFYTKNSSAASYDARIPLLDASGNPKGSDTMANLASVLGVWHFINDASTDLNNVLGDRAGLTVYFVASSSAPANQPSGISSNRFFLEVYNASGDVNTYDLYQRIILRGSNEMYVRYRTGTTWSEWSKYEVDIPSFYKNYADLNALTNALVKQNALSIGNVMVVTNADSYTRFWPADRALESGIASIAVGAGIIENGRTLIIAKDAANKQWATSNVTGGTTAISDRRTAIADFDGRAKTTTILATLGDNAPAAKYCNEYYPSNVASSDGNMGAGRWWLPSLGEWAMIWAHVREVNFVLAAIGGTQIPVGSGWTWSSTEYSATAAWNLYFANGYFSGNNKTGGTSVRPVSAFY